MKLPKKTFQKFINDKELKMNGMNSIPISKKIKLSQKNQTPYFSKGNDYEGT
jgi:hypothetical protein